MSMPSAPTQRNALASRALNQALYRIAERVRGSIDQVSAIADIHRILETRMDAQNFYLVRLDEDRKHFRFLYFQDQNDKQEAPPLDQPLSMDAFAHTVTVAVLRSGKPAFGRPEQVAAELGVDLRRAPGAIPKSWLGVPMLGPEHVEGLLALQSYQHEGSYGSSDLDLLSFVAQLLQAAFERHSMQQLLERRVEERTQALRAEVLEREHAVRLQQALFRIAELAASRISLDACYRALHAIVAELLYARNFFIAMLDAEQQSLSFPYQVDENGDVYNRRQLRKGLTEYVLRLGKPALLHASDILALVAKEEVELIGTPSVCWLGVPLRTADAVVGALVVQSYTDGVGYSESDQALLSFVSVHVASALERVQSQEQLRQSHDELELTLARLREMQTDLVEAEKMAALGQLVAGVAHEVNTPLGIAITANSGLTQQLSQCRKAFNEGTLSKQALNEWIGFSEQASTMVAQNLRRAAELVRTFKQVAVDRSTDDRRRFHLRSFLDDLLPSLALLWKQRPVKLLVEVDPGIEFNSYPGALGQVLTNLVQNALVHAFPEHGGGTMRLSAELAQGDRVHLGFSDDGAGIPDVHLPHVFEPFYTTGRGRGCTGLGLQIVYNLVTEKLGGRIRVDTTLGEGTLFSMELPRSPS